MIVLALDLATRTGWARGMPGCEPTYGSIRWGNDGASIEAVLGEFTKWYIEQTNKLNRPDAIVYEAPIIARYGNTTSNTTAILQRLIGIAQGLGYVRGFHNERLQEVHVKTWRGYFIGRTQVDSKEAKRLTIHKCRLLRWEPEDDNAADALGLWSYKCALLDPSTSIKVTPLFLRAVQ
jgi:crossover junction endodeoxyribonuclease RuvC